MPNKHSVHAQQRRLARRLALTSAFQDTIRQESVNLLTSTQLSSLIGAQFEYVLPGAVEIVRGEVLLDSRGEGSFQRPQV